MFAPDRFEQGQRSPEIDGVALVEIRLRFARDDRGQEEDDVGPAAGEFRRDIGSGDVERLADDRKGRGKRRRRDDIDEPRLGDRPPREASLARQPLAELASDHAGRADDENFHFWLLPLRRIESRLCPEHTPI